jgi:hypothetical protein
VGAEILAYERDGTPLQWPDARASVNGKKTSGSTQPEAVRETLEALRAQVKELFA